MNPRVLTSMRQCVHGHRTLLVDNTLIKKLYYGSSFRASKRVCTKSGLLLFVIGV